MITVLITIVLALSFGTTLTLTDISPWYWSLLWTVLFFAGEQVLLSMWLKRKMGAVGEEVQAILKQGQARMAQKVQRWRNKQMSNAKAAEAELAKDRDALINEVRAVLRPLERYRLWVPLLGRQLATMELQFAWQQKDTKRVDTLLDRALLVDPMLICIKLARLWQKNAPTADLRKVYAKAVRRARYGSTILLASTYAWMLVKRNEIDEAYKVLLAADEANESPVIKTNIQALANNKIAHFNNVGLGDEWFSLWLEEPKIKARRVNQTRYFA